MAAAVGRLSSADDPALECGAMPLRRRVWEIVEVARPGDRASRLFDVTILSLIVLNLIAVIVGTIHGLEERWAAVFVPFEVFSIAVFSVEYVARIWSCVEDPRFASPVSGRLRFALRPLILIDLAAILPAFLFMLGMDLRGLRALRLIRILRLAKAVRYVSALRLLRRVLISRREELTIAGGVTFLLLIVASSLMYAAERQAQPEAFGSIPATMWWAMETLTTVGYGDVYPITLSGRFLGSLVAILGIGLFALPAGILSSGFTEELQKRRREEAAPAHCPHCGEPL